MRSLPRSFSRLPHKQLKEGKHPSILLKHQKLNTFKAKLASILLFIPSHYECINIRSYQFSWAKWFVIDNIALALMIGMVFYGHGRRTELSGCRTHRMASTVMKCSIDGKKRHQNKRQTFAIVWQHSHSDTAREDHCSFYATHWNKQGQIGPGNVCVESRYLNLDWNHSPPLPWRWGGLHCFRYNFTFAYIFHFTK